MRSPRPTALLAMTCGLLAPFAPAGVAAGAPEPSSVGSITAITEPLTRQVVQRRDDNYGSVLFGGRYTGDVDGFQAMSTLEAGMTGRPLGWTALINVAIFEGYFFAILRQPAGGFYDFEIRPTYRGQVGQPVTVLTVGVGEVFITAGQSNSTSWGTPTGFLPSPRVSCFDDGFQGGTDPTYPGAFWRYGVDPQPALDNSTMGSTWPTMATDLANALDVPIGLYAAGYGGTSVATWLPGTVFIPESPINPPILLFDRLINAIKFFSSRGGVRAVLWIQGETDFGANTPPALYRTQLQFIIDQSRAETGVPVKWMVAQTTTPLNTSRLPEKIGLEQAMIGVVDNRLTFQGPDADSIGVPFRIEVGGGPLHFNATGLELLGGYWAIYIYNDPGFLNIGHLPPL